MTHSFTYKTERPWPNPRLKVGAIVGHTTNTTSRLWFRTGNSGEFSVLYWKENSTDDLLIETLHTVPLDLGNLPDVVLQNGPHAVNFDSDTTLTVDLSGLEQGTRYRYALFGNDGHQSRVVLGHDKVREFSTLTDEDGPFSFAFHSCHMPYKLSLFRKRTKAINEEMWDIYNDVLERHRSKGLRFVIAGGDQAYSDGVKTLDIWKYLNKVMHKEGINLSPSLEEMISWYRDIYRGYWGFSQVRDLYSCNPTYMIWDDHEIGDGWGSNDFTDRKALDKVVPDRAKKGLSNKEAGTLIDRMFEAAKHVYAEYQHCHNPDTNKGQWDYTFTSSSAAFFVQDGRGHRETKGDTGTILGDLQMDRFKEWLNDIDPTVTPFAFVVSAVPVLHLSTLLVNADRAGLIEKLGLDDDLRDSWEHEMHDVERKKMVDAMFEAADKGVRICILSGDVHTSAVFRMTHKESGKVIYQLTSSAITYNVARPLGWILGAGVPDDGDTKDGYRFKRLALYTDSNFGLVRVNPEDKTVDFQLYGEQTLQNPTNEAERKPLTHSLAKLELSWPN